jgi:hypothetical protein
LNRLLIILTLFISLVYQEQSLAASKIFSFGVIANVFKENPDEPNVQSLVNDTDADNLAFVVVNGIKSEQEPCSDDIYLKRKALFDHAQNGMIVSVAAADWSSCRNMSDRSAAVERLNRIRDLYFADEFSLGASKIPLIRQSLSPKFRSFSENARWEINGVLFATLNLPSNNNNYRVAAGRNNEFEDRLIANEEWLQRIALYASNKKLKGIVLFCDGNPIKRSADSGVKRDGYIEIRKHINELARKFNGKVLLIHNAPSADQPNVQTINWRNNLGELGADAQWIKITVSPQHPDIFSIAPAAAIAKNSRQ